MEFMMKTSVSKEPVLPEDKGSTEKGNPIKPPDPNVVPKPSLANMQLRKFQTGGSSGSDQQKLYYTPPPKLKAMAQGNFQHPDPHMGAQHNHHSTLGQYNTIGWDNKEGDDYTSRLQEEAFDQSGHEQLENLAHADILHYHQQKPQWRHHNHHEHYHQQPTYEQNLWHEHRAVARGPKLHFPEFSGDDPDGWVRKSEKYFEMVGIPYDQRVSVAVLYITGKAEYWWRGTGCDANRLPWHAFCSMLDERFNNRSEYELVEHFHNLKQVGTVEEYVDKFEELVTAVKRINPNLPHSYYLSSFISGLKSNIKYQVQCHKPHALTDAYWYAKRLEQVQYNTSPTKEPKYLEQRQGTT